MTNTPEKIYLFENPITEAPDDRWLSTRSDDVDIEYIRTDALIEKACKWMKENVSKHIHGPAYIFYKESMIEEFKQAMKGE